MLTRLSDIDRMFGAMDWLRGNIDRLSGELGRTYDYGPSWVASDGMPKTNLYDNGDFFTILAEVPGFLKNDLNIKIQGNYLEISGKREADAIEGYTTHRLERSTVNFSRSFTLQSDVDADKVEATLKNGILDLKLPKSEAAKPKQIDIK